MLGWGRACDEGSIDEQGKMKYSELTDEQKCRIDDAKGPEEIMEMAKAEGYELTDEELEDIAGGSFWMNEYYCPMCGSHDVAVWQNSNSGHCYSCDYRGPFHQLSR